MMDDPERQARDIVFKAEQRARLLIDDAKTQAASIVHKADVEAEMIHEKSRAAHKKLRLITQRLVRARGGYLD